MASRLCPSTPVRQRRPRQETPSHLDFIRTLSCAVCGTFHKTEAAHIRMGEMEYGKRPTGMAEKADDKWTLPLCGDCHRNQHVGSEAAFWCHAALNPFVLALSLWAATGDENTCEQILRLARARR